VIVRLIVLGLVGGAMWAQGGPLREASSGALMGGVMPAFYDGYLYACVPDAMVNLFAPDGHNLASFAIQGGGNRKVRVLSVGIAPDQTLAVGWVDFPSAGIDIRDASGNLVRTIDTGRYIPAHLSFGPDHSLWSLGWQRDADTTRMKTAKEDHSIVRKYSMDGHQMGAYLARSLFPAGLEPGMSQWQERRITVTGDRVGIEAISGTSSDQREWVELDLDGNLLGRWRLDPSVEHFGVAFTSDNQLYVEQRDAEGERPHLFRLNRASSTWEPVKVPATEGLFLYGADGDALVFGRWPDGVMHMSWFAQPEKVLKTLSGR
jgi:hypothetical protein